MSFSSVVTALSPYAWYRCNEASGTTLVDASGNSRNGTISGTVTLQQAGLLTDSNHSILTSTNAFLNLTSASGQPGNSNSAFTLGFIFKPGTLTTSYVASAQNGDGTHFWQIIHDATANQLQLNLNTTVIASANDIAVPLASNNGQANIYWLTYDGAGNWALYLNGSGTPLLSATGRTLTTNSTSYSLIVAGSQGEGASALSIAGNFQDIMLYSSVVSQTNRLAVFVASGIVLPVLPGVTTVANKQDGVHVSWTGAAGGTAPYVYNVYRANVSTASLTGATLVYTGASTSFTDVPGNYYTYYYIVTATDSSSTPVTAKNIAVAGQTQVQYAVFCVGDSRTLGTGSSGGSDPVTLLAYMFDATVGNCFMQISNRGASGSATSHWLPGNRTYTGTQGVGAVNYTFVPGTDSLLDTAIVAFKAVAAALPSGTKAYVQIMLGPNDANSQTRRTVPDYVTNITAIINAIQTANIPKFAGIVLHCSHYAVPYYLTGSVYDETANQLMQQYNAALLTLVDNVTVFAGDMQAYNFFAAHSTDLLGTDGIHPGNPGYAALAKLWLSVYIKLIKPTLFDESTNVLNVAPHAYTKRAFNFKGTYYNQDDPVFDPNYSLIIADPRYADFITCI